VDIDGWYVMCRVKLNKAPVFLKFVFAFGFQMLTHDVHAFCDGYGSLRSNISVLSSSDWLLVGTDALV
jgi:hypothetical protein